MCVSKPKAPPPPAPIPDRVAEQQPAQSAQAERATDQVKRKAGYASMLLTPPQGLGMPNVGKTLLGA